MNERTAFASITLSTAQSALSKFVLGILVLCLLPCSITYAAASPEDEAKLASLGAKLRQLYEAGKFAEAIPVAQQTLELEEKTLGPEHAEVAGSLAGLGFLHHQIGDFAKAEPFYQRALQLLERTLGPDNIQSAKTLSNLAELYRSSGDYAKAQPLQERALRIWEKADGPDHPNTAIGLNNLALLYSGMGEYEKAEPLLQRSLEILEKTAGAEHPDTAMRLHNLAELYRIIGKYPEAEPLLQRAIKIREKVLGPEHPHTVESLNNLALIHGAMGDHAKAESLMQQVLTTSEKTRGREHPETAKIRNNLAQLRRNRGDDAKAERLEKGAVKNGEKEQVRSQRSDPKRTQEALALLEQGSKEMTTGDYRAGLKTFERILPLVERSSGPEQGLTASIHGGLGMCHYGLGDYAQAEPHMLKSVELTRKEHGDEHRFTGVTVWQLGLLYNQMGDRERAEGAFRKAVEIARVAFPGNWKHVTMLMSLAGVIKNVGKEEEAEALAKEAVDIFERIDPNHPTMFGMLQPMATAYQQLNRLPEARRLAERSLEMTAAQMGPESPALAQAHFVYAWICFAEGRFAESAEHFERCLGIAAKQRTASSLEFSAADALATARFHLNEIDAARRAARSSQEFFEKFMANLLSFTSERQRLARARAHGPHDKLAQLGDAEGVARSVLRLKGLVLDSILEDRAVAAEAERKGQAARLAELQMLKRRLFESSNPASADAAMNPSAATPRDLFEKVEQLESSLARSLAAAGRSRRALEVTTEQVQAVLPAETALVELFHYDDVVSGMQTEGRYGAVILRNTGQPRLVPLGDAAAIDKELRLYRSSVRGLTDEPTLLRSLHALHDRVWGPIEAQFDPGVRAVILAPDGDLNSISFATLLGSDNTFVGEKYSLRYVASGRDLLRPKTKTTNRAALVFANPEFGSGAGAPLLADARNSATAKSLTGDLAGLRLLPLPGTAEEAAALATRRGGNPEGMQALTGSAATEKRLQQVKAPRILHLATHGFFLADDAVKRPGGLSARLGLPAATLSNPMHRSGLALAGAQQTLEAWQRGQFPPTANDGIVTAEEVGNLNLKGTWLVVLSACDTGSGEAQAGEGVLGLRRGFVQAGAQNLMMTLWPISDAATIQIMLDFYDAADKTNDAAQALADVQRDWLVRLRKERGLQAAVQLAGPFIMNTQGKP